MQTSTITGHELLPPAFPSRLSLKDYCRTSINTTKLRPPERGYRHLKTTNPCPFKRPNAKLKQNRELEKSAQKHSDHRSQLPERFRMNQNLSKHKQPLEKNIQRESYHHYQVSAREEVVIWWYKKLVWELKNWIGGEHCHLDRSTARELCRWLNDQFKRLAWRPRDRRWWVINTWNCKGAMRERIF